jgi:hypothetical protein
MCVLPGTSTHDQHKVRSIAKARRLGDKGLERGMKPRTSRLDEDHALAQRNITTLSEHTFRTLGASPWRRISSGATFKKIRRSLWRSVLPEGTPALHCRGKVHISVDHVTSLY